MKKLLILAVTACLLFPVQSFAYMIDFSLTYQSQVLDSYSWEQDGDDYVFTIRTGDTGTGGAMGATYGNITIVAEGGESDSVTLAYSVTETTGSGTMAAGALLLSQNNVISGDGEYTVDTGTEYYLGGMIVSNDYAEIQVRLTATDAASAVPVPGTILLLGVGLAGLAGLRREMK